MAASALIAGTRDIAMTLHVLPVVALQTQFGQWVLLRLVLLITVLVQPLAGLLPRVGAIVLAGVALAVQPLIGHAGAIGGSPGIELTASETLHLFAAGAWLGGLLPLLIAIRILPAQAAASACHGFTPSVCPPSWCWPAQPWRRSSNLSAACLACSALPMDTSRC